MSIFCIKKKHPTLLSLVLFITSALASDLSNDAFQSALDQENIAHIQELLASHDLDINMQNQEGNTALMLAIWRDYITLAKKLLRRHDIDVNKQDKDGYTALIFAISTKNITISELLLQRDDINVNLQNEFGSTALMLAICRNYITLSQALLQRDDINVNLQNGFGSTTLMLAICRNYIALSELLLQRDDINVNLQDYNKKTALAYIKHNHIDLTKPQNNSLYYVSLVQRTYIPSLDKDHALLQPSYLHTLYMQESCNQTIQPYRDILLINKIANELTEEQKTIFYQACLLAYESKNSNYSIQTKSITYTNPSSHYQPLLDEDLIHLLAGYLREVNMKRVSYESDWAHYITCYLWTNNQFALQHNPANMSLKAIHFWSNHNSTYAELLSTANRTQNRTLFKVIAQQGQYEAVPTQHLAHGLKQKNIIQKKEEILEKSVTWVTPIIVAGLKTLTHKHAA